MAFNFDVNIGDIFAGILAVGVWLDHQRYRRNDRDKKQNESLILAEEKGRHDREREEVKLQLDSAFEKLRTHENSIASVSETQIELRGYIRESTKIMEKVQNYMEKNIGDIANLGARVDNLERKE